MTYLGGAVNRIGDGPRYGLNIGCAAGENAKQYPHISSWYSRRYLYIYIYLSILYTM